jgi:hypothetical protein
MVVVLQRPDLSVRSRNITDFNMKYLRQTVEASEQNIYFCDQIYCLYCVQDCIVNTLQQKV